MRYLIFILGIFISVDCFGQAEPKQSVLLTKQDALRMLGEGNALNRSSYISKYQSLLRSSVLAERTQGVRGLGAIQDVQSVEALLKVAAEERDNEVLQEAKQALQIQLQMGMRSSQQDTSVTATAKELADMKSLLRAKGYSNLIADQWKLVLKLGPEGEKMFAVALSERFDPALCEVWLKILKTTTLESVKKLATDCLQSWGGWPIEDIEKGALSEEDVIKKSDVESIGKRYREILIKKRLIYNDSNEKIAILWIAHASNDLVSRAIAFRLLTIN